MNMSYVGAGAVLAVGAFSFLESKRRRRVATDEDANGQTFVEMKDTFDIADV